MKKTTRKPRGDGHERYPEILEAALRVFASEGQDKTTMRRLAEEVGMSTTGLYIYFENKEAILNAIREKTLADLHNFSQTAYEDANTPEDRLRCHLKAYLNYACDNPDSYRLTFRSLLIRSPSPGRKTNPKAAASQADFNVLVSEIAALVPQDIPDHADLSHSLAETTWAFIHGISSLAIDVPQYPTLGIDSCFEQAMTMILSGIHAYTRDAGADNSEAKTLAS